MDAGRLSQAGLLRLALGRGMVARAGMTASHLANDVLLLRSWGVPVVLDDELRVLCAHTSANAELTATHPVLVGETHHDLAWVVAGLLEGTRESLDREHLVARLTSRGWSSRASEPAVIVWKAARTAAARYAPVQLVDEHVRWVEQSVAHH